jgi:hypothetical protein
VEVSNLLIHKEGVRHPDQADVVSSHHQLFHSFLITTTIVFTTNFPIKPFNNFYYQGLLVYSVWWINIKIPSFQTWVFHLSKTA